MNPGGGRSGATIMGARALGVERKTAAEFSFFLAVPTMLAASGYDLLKSHEALTSNDWLATAICFVVSFIVPLLVICWFVGVCTWYGFSLFACYRIVSGFSVHGWPPGLSVCLTPIRLQGCLYKPSE